MSNDRSLDDFVGTDSDDETGEDETEEREQPEPATPTYRFSPDGAVCDACGDVGDRHWHDDGQFVCADCKEW